MRSYKRKTKKTTKNNNNKNTSQEKDEHICQHELRKITNTSSNISKSNCNNTGSNKHHHSRNNKNSNKSIKRSYGIGNNLTWMIRSWWWIYCCCYICLLSSSGNINVVNGSYSSDTDDLINELDRPSE